MASQLLNDKAYAMPRIATDCICCLHAGLERQGAVLMPFVARRAFGWQPCEITSEWGLRDLPVGPVQALCNTLHCPRCGLIFLDMRFDDAEMARLYADYRGPTYEAEREACEPGYARRNRALLAGDAHIPAVEALLAPWLPAQPAILDWGGDTGLNTPLRSSARVHDVLDISGRPLVPGARAVAGTAHLSERYDLVVLSNVLEHVPEPAQLLNAVARQLKTMAPQVRLYVEVPHEALAREALVDALAWRRKRHWHEHVNFFSVAALQTLVQRCGLQVLEQRAMSLEGGGEQLGLVCAPCD